VQEFSTRRADSVANREEHIGIITGIRRKRTTSPQNTKIYYGKSTLKRNCPVFVEFKVRNDRLAVISVRIMKYHNQHVEPVIADFYPENCRYLKLRPIGQMVHLPPP